MSDEEDLQFETKRHKLTKNQQIYGMFNQAYEDDRPTLGATKKQDFKRKNYSNHGKMMNFKAGEVVNPNNEKVQINIPEGKKKKKVTFSGEQKIHTFQTEPNQPLTMESFLQQIASEEDQPQVQIKEEEKKQQGLSENVKRSLKLYKYSEYHKPKTMADYGLPEQFGKKPVVAPPKPQKTAQQIELEHEYSKKYGLAYKMLLKTGWKAGDGLGKEKQGIKAPVEAVFKTSLMAQDNEDVEEPEMPKQPSEQEQTNTTHTRGFQQLFDYFSQNEEINIFLKDLKNDYQKLTTIIDRQEEQVEKLTNRVSQLQSHILQTENQQAILKNNIKQLNEIKIDLFNCEKYPHHALKFDVDLLIVKMSYENIDIESFEQLHEHRQSIFDELAQMRVKLQKIYLQKEKQNIRNFTKSHIENMLYEKVIDVEGLQEKAQISQEDIQKIKKFVRLLLDEKVLPVLTPKISKLDLDDNSRSQMILDVLEMLAKLDSQLIRQLSQEHVIQKINSQMGKFNVKDKVPIHLVIFPWFTVVNPGALNYSAFLKRLYSLEWQPEDPVMLNCIKHWQPYMPKECWSDLVGLCIAPKLLHMMERFTISASDGNMKNLTKVKTLMQYQQIVDSPYLEAILEDTLIKQVQKTYKNLKATESQESVMKWLDMWRRTVFRIVGRGALTDRLDRLSDS